MKLIIKSLILILSGLIFVFVGCGSPLGSTDQNSTAATCATSTPPSYSGGVAQVLNSSCVSCHGNYSTYAGATTDAANIALEVGSGLMPPGGALSPTFAAEVVQWADCGTAP